MSMQFAFCLLILREDYSGEFHIVADFRFLIVHPSLAKRNSEYFLFDPLCLNHVKEFSLHFDSYLQLSL